MKMMGRRATEGQLDDNDTRERGSQRRREEREWRADLSNEMEGCQSLV